MANHSQDDSNYRKTVNSWAMYHWAENAYAATVMAAILPVYYSHVAASTLSANQATVYWGYTNTIGLLLAALLAPMLGTVANLLGIRKKLLIIFTALGVFTTATLYFVKTGDWLMASVIFIISNLGFALSDVFHDSLLPHVAKPEDIDRVSTRGYAIGYLGGGILLAINVLMLQLMSDKGLAARLSFVSVSIWWAIFTIPLILNVREPEKTGEGRGSTLAAGYKELSKTFHNIKRYRELTIFLIAFLIYNDGIGTIIKMATIYGAEIGIGRNDLIGALLMTQFVGIPFAFGFGRFAKSIGTKNCIYIGLFVYTIISIGGYFISTALDFWILAFLVGTVQGGTQALSRSYFGSMIPKAKTAEFFGFYGMSSRMGGFIGPFIFAVVGQLTGNSRLSIISLIIFFVLGAILLSRVNEKEGLRIAKEEDLEIAD
ncbi:MAG: MFS transporter [Candidatus Latescibacteria bacterium]|nr:MFS transporter [Candidatus Latescibacterota bacterium]